MRVIGKKSHHNAREVTKDSDFNINEWLNSWDAQIDVDE